MGNSGNSIQSAAVPKLTRLLQQAQVHFILPPLTGTLVFAGTAPLVAGPLCLTAVTSLPGARGLAAEGSVTLRARNSSKCCASFSESVQVCKQVTTQI